MFLTFLIFFFFFYNFAHSYSILGLLVNLIDTPNYAFTHADNSRQLFLTYWPLNVGPCANKNMSFVLEFWSNYITVTSVCLYTCI